MAQLLVTGGAGFIGSHTCLVLLQAGHSLVIVDDFSNSNPIALDRVKDLVGPKAASRLTLYKADIRVPNQINRVFSCATSSIDAVIHFAGLKSVNESFNKPLYYWDVNVAGTLTLLNSMVANGCHTLVFSSSATVYGNTKKVPITEKAPIKPTNPYGHTKAAVEQMLRALAVSRPDVWRIACLRYFNPVGAHPSGRIGEDPLGIPNNLFPLIAQVASGRLQKLQVFGGDWPTPDGTGVRDYIHVMDLAESHRAAIDTLLSHTPQSFAVNVGTGVGTSVLEAVQAFAKVSRRDIPYIINDRRPGDAAISLADPMLAADILHWRTKLTLSDMCNDAWSWQQANPLGYRS